MRIKFLLLAAVLVLFAFCENQKTTNKNQVNVDFDQQITNKYWKMIELNGEKVEMEDNQEREAYFMLRDNENKVTGFAGCNQFSGDYELDDHEEVKFSKLGGTLKSCPDLSFNENDFLKIFEDTSHYELGQDQLNLKDEEGNILARFEAIYF